jgi:hypothetical protein
MTNIKPNLFIVAANHLLLRDKTMKSWSSNKQLRSAWNWLFAWLLGFFALTIIFRVPLRNLVSKSADVTLVYRWVMVVLSIGLIVIAFYFTFFYAKFVINKRGRLHLRSVLFFYVLTVVGFAKLYYFLYFIDPSLFLYSGSPINPSPLLTDMMAGNYLITLEFVLFSALNSLNTQYHGITANSAWVSVALFFQSLYTLCLVAVLIAGYVNQRFEYVKEDNED